MLKDILKLCGLIAILRGVRPDEAVDIAQSLYAAGFRAIEVPLNSPEPFESIRKIRASLPSDCVVGRRHRLSSPNRSNRSRRWRIDHHHAAQRPKVIVAAKCAGMEVLPGVATATEAFAAFAAGASFLKLFPADHLGTATLKAWRSVLPRGAGLIPVGGIHPGNIATFVAAGAAGFGIGSALYKPGMSVPEVEAKAAEFVEAWQTAQAS